MLFPRTLSEKKEEAKTGFEAQRDPLGLPVYSIFFCSKPDLLLARKQLVSEMTPATSWGAAADPESHRDIHVRIIPLGPPATR